MVTTLCGIITDDSAIISAMEIQVWGHWETVRSGTPTTCDVAVGVYSIVGGVWKIEEFLEGVWSYDLQIKSRV